MNMITKKMKYKIVAGVFLLSLITGNVFAQSDDVEQAFKNIIAIDSISVVVPTVVDVTFDKEFLGIRNVLVHDVTDGKFTPSLIKENRVSTPKNFFVSENGTTHTSIHDGNYQTYAEFPLSTDGLISKTSLKFNYTTSIRTNTLSINLSEYVARPTSVTIYYIDDSGVKKVALSKDRSQSQTLRFPEVRSKQFEVELEYAQPLRISEISFVDNDISQNDNPSLRFLAQPNHDYVAYINADRYVSVAVGESGDLNGTIDVFTIVNAEVLPNNFYKEPDVDGDGIVDEKDNCVRVANEDQVDIDGNGRGDSCDDFDKDGIINSQDNCVNDPNRRQTDTDGDGQGDTCDDEESRITEKYPFIVWGGIGFAILLFVILYFSAIRGMQHEKKREEEGSDVNEGSETNSSQEVEEESNIN